jgi:hypothetical protein
MDKKELGIYRVFNGWLAKANGEGSLCRTSCDLLKLVKDITAMAWEGQGSQIPSSCTENSTPQAALSRSKGNHQPTGGLPGQLAPARLSGSFNSQLHPLGWQEAPSATGPLQTSN